MPNPSHDTKIGLWAAISAYGMWGIVPVYWKQLTQVPAWEIMLHRVWWSFVLLFLFMLVSRRLIPCLRLLKDRRVLLTLMASGALIGANWFIFIWAVNNGHILDTSLGYFLSPVLNMLCGVILFKDILARPQWLAAGLAAAGVGLQIIITGSMPLIALFLGTSFTIYGVIRKTAPVGALDGLFIETLLLAPFILGCMLWLGFNNELYFAVHANNYENLFLLGAGIITTLPLVWFAYGARNLRLTTLGLVQYLSPSLTFLTGIFIYQEAISFTYLLSFILIWCGLVVYTLAGIRQYRLLQKIMKNHPGGQ